MTEKKTLPTRQRFAVLAAIVPPPAAPAPVNLFGATPDDTFGQRFDHGRLLRRAPRSVDSEAQERGDAS
ncbi:hypothetical protein [Streptomyces sp. NPDC056069]|uniref:hypothetical protein n=1 Tax=Streptomyces sp. NPDC056069 TaxID=3345702 RepID=UPI0035E1FC95